MWLKIASIQHEYWLTEDGPVFADGDVSDDNHDILAEGHLLGELNDDIGDSTWGTPTFYNNNNLFHEANYPGQYIGQMQDFAKHLQETHGDNWQDHMGYEDYLRWINTHHIDDERKRILRLNQVNHILKAMSNPQKRDPRKYVSQHYNWVRVQGNNIEVWEMNDVTRNRIRKQLEDLYYEENEHEYDNDGDEAWKDQPVFDLSILSSQKYIPNLTFEQLANYTERAISMEPDAYTDLSNRNRPTGNKFYKYQGG